MTDPLLLPAGCRLVHIGPHKTGTTAVQWALHHAREELHAQGVHYAHPRPQAYKPAIALTGLRGRVGGPKVDDKPWLRLVAEVERERDRRVVISSESFSNASRPHIERLADDLGRDRVHIVRMLRRYDKMLPSQWQQTVAARRRQPFETYLDNVAADPQHAFWRRHGYAELTRRWAEVVGPENVTAVVVDEGDHDWLLRVMERMLGLVEGTLRPQPERSNRSLTRGEVELQRRFNHLREQVGWADRVHFNYVRLAASPAMRLMPPDPAGGRIELPRALRPMVAAATERDLEALAELGVRVVGDTELLRPPPADTRTWGDGTPEPASIAAVGAAAAVAAVVARVDEHGPISLANRARARVSPPASEESHDDEHAPAAPLARRTRMYVVPPPGPEGHRLRESIQAARGLFADAKRPCRVADRLDEVAGRRVHVVLVAVPPRQLLASRWHDHVVGRDPLTFAAWQREVPLPDGDLPGLIREAVQRWDAKRVSVVAADVFDPAKADRALAALGDVAPDRMQQLAGSRRVLSWAETALVRRLDEHAREQGWDEPTWQRYVVDGVVPWLLSTGPAQLHRGIGLDERSADWVRRESRALLDTLASCGVRVVGDLRPVRQGTRARPSTTEEPRLRPITGALALGGAIAATEPRSG
jgi:hypothetical protein